MAMPEKEPLIYQIVSQVASLLYIFLLGSFFGIVGYLAEIKKKDGVFQFKWAIVVFFVGGANCTMAFLLCDLAGFSWQLTSFLSGGSAAMGVEGLHRITDRAGAFIKGEANGNG